jgi:hypothetical protein
VLNGEEEPSVDGSHYQDVSLVNHSSFI